MGTEKGGAKVGGGGGGGGVLFNLFDWKRKSRKKLFSNSPEGSKPVKRSEETLPSGRLHLVDEEEGGGVASIKGSSDYSCASSVTDEEGREMKAPGVVARLMGLDAMPSSGVSEPYCTPFRDTRSFRDSHSLKRSPEYSVSDQFSHVPRRIDGYVRKPLDLRAQKMPSSPIERFQIEALPPRSAKPHPMSHHRLLSPIKNPGFSSARNAAQIMEAAAKILEPRPQVSSREKICSFSPARIPLRVCESRESAPACQRPSRQQQSCRAPLELPDVRFSRGQQLNRSWNTEDDIVIFRPSLDSYEINNPGCSKSNSKGKSISLALQAKVNVQKREGLNVPGRNSGAQKEHDEFRANQPFRSQSNPQRNKQQKKPSGTSSPVLRQNNQKQNSLVSRGKVAPNKSVATQQARKVLPGDSSSGKLKNGNKVSKVGSRKDIVESISDDREGLSSNNKDFPQKKRLIERNSTNEKGTFVPEKPVARPQKHVQPNVVMDEHIKWSKESKDSTDVVSFTFSSPLVKSSAGPSRLAGKWDTRSNFSLDAGSEKDDLNKNVEGLSSVGLKFVNGDALSLLLEKKLRELTSKIEPSITFTRGDTFAPSSFTLEEPPASSCGNWDAEHGVFDCSPFEGKLPEYLNSCQSSTKGQIFRGHKLQVEEQAECSSISDGRKEQEHEDLSPLSVLEPTFLTESCLSSECSGSSDGCKGYSGYSSSSELKNIFSSNFLNNPPSIDTETKLTDSASSASVDTLDISDITHCSRKSRNADLEYIGDILSSMHLTAEELGSLFINQDRSALDPLLFDKLENMKRSRQGGEPLDCRGHRRLLFDCVNECLDIRRVTYFQAGYAAWNKGMAVLSKGIETEVFNEISAWKSMGSWMEDELVDKDMSSGLGTWVDFRIEAFETSEEVEKEILSSLLDEVIGDVCRRRLDCKFVMS